MTVGDDLPVLFDEVPQLSSDEGGSALVRTPLGDLRLRARFGDGAEADPTDACRIVPDGRLFVLRDDRVHAELLLVTPELDLPHCMSVDGCVAGVWRVRAMDRVPSCEFSCRWDPGFVWSDAHGPESGESLDAQSWSRGRIRVSVGTQDVEFLRARAIHGDRLPASWGKLLGYGEGESDPVRYVEDGFLLSLPPLVPGDLCQVQFTVAWAEHDSDDASTWFAVDCRWEQILRSLGGGRR